MFVAASDLLQDSDSSTESSIQNSKQAARLHRRLKKYKNQKRYGAAHIFDNIVQSCKKSVSRYKIRTFWHERAAFQRSAFGWSTAGNDIQGVSQYFGHLETYNFSASEAPRIKSLDIFRKPGQF